MWWLRVPGGMSRLLSRRLRVRWLRLSEWVGRRGGCGCSSRQVRRGGCGCPGGWAKCLKRPKCPKRPRCLKRPEHLKRQKCLKRLKRLQRLKPLMLAHLPLVPPVWRLLPR